MWLELKEARYNFASSIAGYSLICYLLQIKDRHNGNILIDRKGHLIHIDFDFFISNSPGNNSSFESAPFKFTKEYVNVMEGQDSECFKYFKLLMRKGFTALQKEYKKIMVLIEMMLNVNRNLPCFFEKTKTLKQLEHRFFPPRIGKRSSHSAFSDEQAEKLIEQYYNLI